MFFFLSLTLFAALPSALLVILVSHGSIGRSRLVHFVGISGPGIAAFAALVTAIYCLNNGPLTTYNGFIYVDALSALMLSIIALVSLLTITYSVPYMGRELAHGTITVKKLGWYYFWMDLLIAAMYTTMVINSLGITWVLIEATTLASVPLVGFYGKPQSLEAAWKYLIIASVGISFALLGILLTYVASVSNLVENQASLDFTFLLSNAATLDQGLMKLAFIFILIGYGTKTGLAPMHTWLPDAHSQAPAPISALLSGALLNCALYGILRFNSLTNAALNSNFTSTLLQIFGLLSIGIVIPFIISQDDFKRMLAYSSVEHMGIITLALGIGGELGRIAVALHLFNHALAKSFMFCVAGEVTERYHTREISKIRGVLQSAPLLGIFLFIGALAISGTPPFNIFLSEFMVISAAFAMHQNIAAYILLILLTMVFASLIYHVVNMAFGKGKSLTSKNNQEISTETIASTESQSATVITSPSILSGFAEKAGLVIFTAPAFTLLILGLWLPWFMQNWLHTIGAVLK